MVFWGLMKKRLPVYEVYCIMCSKKKDVHPEFCKPLWAREIVEGPRYYETSASDLKHNHGTKAR